MSNQDQILIHGSESISETFPKMTMEKEKKTKVVIFLTLKMIPHLLIL